MKAGRLYHSSEKLSPKKQRYTAAKSIEYSQTGGTVVSAFALGRKVYLASVPVISNAGFELMQTCDWAPRGRGAVDVIPAGGLLNPAAAEAVSEPLQRRA